MNGSSNIIVLILVIIAALAIVSVAAGEGFCNCAGLGWKTPKPTYYVYRPTGDVSNYGARLPQSGSGSVHDCWFTAGHLPRTELGLAHRHAL